ncbi:VCBS domain-containing protein [Bradyrhizobium elkanii]|uniref:VCBS domain-containing protein n=1 Tax=Bradyrhizobium elkanii TaxID=29448 RepID=UPI00384C61CD
MQLGKAGATPDVDTLQIWLSAAQLADADIQAEISYYKNTWVPAHINAQTGQADGTIYTFKTLNLQVSAIEKVEVRDASGNLTIAATADTASATEAGGINNGTAGVNPTGNVLTNDFDFSAASKTVAGVAAGTTSAALSSGAGTDVVGAHGTLHLNADGSYTYTVNNGQGAVEALRTFSDTLTDTFSYTVKDTTGATATTTLTVTIHGADDAPVAVADIASATEAGGVNNGTAGANPTGNVLTNDTDVDAGDTKTVAGVAAGTTSAALSSGAGSDVVGAHGTLHLNTDGSYTYTVNNGQGAVEALRTSSDTLTDTFSYTVKDTAGQTSTTTLTVTIHGTDDAPVAVADVASATEAGGVNNGTAGVNPTGNVLTNDTDVDAGDTKTVAGVAAGTISTSLSSGAGTDVVGAHGTLHLNADGSYTYTVNNGQGAVEALRTSSDTLTDTFSYTVKDTAGQTSTTTLTVTIHGTDDAPVAVADTGSANEGGITPATAASGNVLTNDTDVDNVHSDLVVSAVAGGTVGAGLAGAYGTVTINADGSYSYVIDDANPTVDALNVGGTLTDTFTYTVSDGQGGTSSTTLTITIHGTDDAPVAVADTGSANEGGITPATAASGNVLTNDTDVDNVHSDLVVSAVAGGTVGAGLAGAYGTVTINADGSYSYVIDDANPTVDALNVGGTLTDTFTYTVSDGQGGTSSTTLTITIHGTDDAPVAVADTGSANEGGITPATAASGNVLTNDTDVDNVHSDLVVSAVAGGTVGAGLAGAYGTVTINADGSYSYVIDDANPTVDALNVGGTLTDTFTYTVSDGQGGTSSTTLTITIHGTDDAPVAVADTGSANEGGITPATAASGNVLTNDTDVDNVHSDLVVSAVAGGTVGAGLAGAYGTVTINADGSYSYVIDDANPTVDALNVGGTLTDTFTYTVSDGQGGTSSTTLTITIHGTDDAPVAVADTGSANEGGITPATAASGNVLTNDTDVDNVHSDLVVSAVAGGTVGAGLAGAYGTVTINADGSYSYVIDDANPTVDALNVGGTLTDTFTYTVSDGQGGTSSTTLTITIHGTDDAPVAVADTGSANEGGITPATAASGNVLTNDTDVDNVHSDLVVSAVAGGTVGAGLAGAYGTVTINADGSYSYVIDDANPTVDALNVGGTLTDTFTYTVSDGQGGTSSTTLTITIHGTDDAPVAVADTGSANEGGITPATAASGNVLTNDTDVDNVHSDLVVSAVAGGTVGAGLAGAYGTVTINADGSYSYVIDDANPTVDALNVGGTLTDTFTYTVSDGQGGTSSTTLTITIHGTDDAPVAVADTGSANEGGITPATAASGNVLTNDTDVDNVHSDLVVSAVAGGTVGAGLAGAYGTVTINADGSYSYVIDDANPTVDALNVGGTLTDTFTYTVSDGQGGTSSTTLTITIHGTDDAPVAVADTGSANEGGITPATAASGNVLTNDTDVDNVHSDLVVSAVAGGTVGAGLAGAYGTVTINADGSYSYVIDDANPTVDALNVGGTLTDTFTYTVSDGQGGTSSTTLTITIHGTDDAPVAVADTGSANEGGITPATAASGNVLTNDTDVDNVHSDLVVSAVAGGTVGAGLAGAYGTVTINADGSYSYVIDDANPTVDALNVGGTLTDTFTYTVSDGQGGTSSTTLTITIHGTDDAPVAVADTGSANEGGITPATAASGNVLTNDTDVDNVHSDLVVSAVAGGTVGAGLAGAYGTVTINADGSYSYVIDDANPTVDALNVGGTLTDTFTYTVSDGQGGTSSTTLTITIHGTDDAPVAVADTGSANEGGITPATAASGNVLTNDTDVDNVHSDLVVSAVAGGTVGAGLAGAYGTVTINADGSYSYVIDDANPTVDALNVGGTLTDTFTYTVSDGQGGTSSTTLTITIHGTDDAPVAVADTGSANEGGITPATAASGNVLTNDTDVDNVHSDLVVSAVAGGTVGAGLAGAYGTVTINADGSYSYVIDDANPTVDALNVGGTLTDTFTYTVSDGQGGTSSTTLTITIHGTDDAPVAVADTGSANEGGITPATAASGNVLTNDTDVDNVHSDLVVSAVAGGTVGAGLAGAYGTVTINADGSYSYVIDDANPTVDALNVGGTLTDTFTYTVSDGQGGTSSTTLTITIHGTDDAPVAVADTGSANEGGITPATAASGNVLTNDTDVDNVHSDLVVSAVAGGTVGAGLAGAYGTVTINADGSYSYVIDDANPTVDALNVGGTLTDTFTYTVSDGQGGTSSTTLTITIHGTDDAPVAVADTGSANEGGITPATAASGNVLTNDTDVDNVHSDLVVSAVAGGTVGAGLAGAYGTVTINADGSYSYVIDDANPTVDALNVGGTLTDTFTYTVSDGQGGTSSTTLTITIHGTDDAPVAVADTGSANEGGITPATAASGNVLTNDTDVDNVHSDLVVSAVAGGTVGAGLAGAYGTVTINADGSYSYVIDDANPTVDALNVGGTLTDTFTYTVSDGQGGTSSTTLTITIHGTDDAPVAVADTGSANEGGITPATAASGNVLTNDTDVDNVHSDLVVSAVAGGTVGAGLAGAYGTVTINADGSYSYVIDDANPTVDALNVGGTLTDTFTYTVSDGQGGTSSTTLTITIHGTDDAPVAVADTGSANEGGITPATAASGNVLTNDTDVDNVHSDLVVSAVAGGTVGAGLAGAYGTVTINADGSYSYVIDDANPTVDALNVGGTLTDTFTYTVSDGQGGTSSTTLTITIHGTDDAPVAVADTGSANEGGITPATAASGNVLTNDTDVDNVHSDLVVSAVAGGTVGAGLAGAYGTVTINADGSYSYVIDDANPTVDALNVGGTLTDTFTYTVSDGQGGTSSTTLTITIHGTDDAPVAVADTGSANEGGITPATAASGNVLTNDTDVDNVHSDLVVSAVAGGTVGAGLAGAYGTVTINADGSYSYVIDDANPTVDALNVGGTLTDTFTYTVSDGQGGTSSTTLTITIHGTDDAPVAVADTGSANEGGITPATAASGNVLTNDTDVDNVHSDLVVSAVAGGTVGAGLAGAYGTVTINADGSYSYVIDDANPTVDALNVGGTLTDTFTYTVSDGQGGTSSTTLTITIHGTDDAPVAVADTGSANEGGITPATAASGNVLTNDTDVDNVHSDLVVSAVAGGTVGAGLAGAYGTVTINADGSYSYVIDDANPTVDALNVGGTLTDTFTYTVSDGQGGTSSTTLTITIHGTDDAPVAVADTGSANEGGITPATAASGNVLTNDTDVDNVHSDLVVSAVAGGTVGAGLAGAYGTVTINADGSYSYVIDDANPTVDALNVGGTLTDTFTYTVSDGQGGTSSTTLTITIHGTDDAPVAVADTGSANEGGITPATAASGNVLTNDTDVDNVHSDLVVSAVAGGTVGAGLAGAYGTVTINADGSYSYVIDDANPTVDALNVGGTLTDTFTYTVSDGQGGTSSTTLTITIHGTDDAPVAVADTGSANEGGITPATAASGNVLTNDTDVDNVHSDLVVSAVAGGTVGAGLAGAYGTVTINADGSYSYVIDDANPTVDALNVGGTLTDTFTYTVSDGQGGTSSTTLTITIHGTDDAPVAVADTGSANEGGITPATAASGNVLTNDTDVDNVHSDLVVSAVAGGTVGAGLAGAYGTVTINADGSYSYVIDDANPTVDALNVGGTLTDTFTYTVSDGQGGTSSTTLTITIHGTDDAPVAVADTGSANEGGITPATAASGNVLTNDTDVDNVHSDLVVSAVAGGTVGAGLAGAYGTVTINADGSYSYVIDDANPTVDALNVGGTLTDTFTYTVSDGQGGTSSTTLTITIHGTDDAPVAVADTGSANEGGITPATAASGNVLTNDTDVDNVHSDLVVSAVAGGTVGAGLAGAYGTVTINADGSYSYVIDDANPTVDALNVGGTLTDTFTYTVSDGQGGTSSTTLTITIHGTDDAPVAVADTGSANEGGITPATAASGNVLTNDTDVDNVHSDLVVSAVAGGTVGAGLAGAYGTVTINADGSYSYVIDDANPTVDALNVGGTLTDTFTYTVSDGQGGTSSTTLTITIHGTDDAPVAVADTGSANEGGITPATAASGNVLTNDTDVDNVHSDLVVSAVAGGTVGAGLAGAYGTVTINADGSYSYVIDDANPTVDALNVGGTLTDTFTYTVSDGQGGTSSTTLTITIHGTDDAPVAVADTGSANEGGITPATAASGNVLTNDTDVDNVHSDLVVSAVAGGTVGAGLAGAYGTVTINADGSYSYVIDDANPTVDALNVGGTLTDTFTYTVSDGQGGTSSTTLTITIHGTDDAPVAVADTGSANEGGITPATAASGNVLTNDTDVDNVHSDLVVSAVAGGTVGAGLAGAYGTVTINADGSYSYVIDDANPTVDALNVGGTLTDTFTYTVSDGQGGTSSTTLTITIHGTDDAPVAVADTGSANEGGITPATAASGNVLTNDTDVDNVHSDLVVSAVAGGTVGAGLAGAYGTVTINADGSYSYVIDDANPTVDALNVGGTLTDTFTYTVSDGQGGTSSTTLTITIHGTDDAPVAVADTGSANEGGITPATAASGNVLTNDTDVDNVHSDLVVSAVAGGTVGAGLAGAYGTVTINADGSYSYVIDDANPTVDALNVGGTLTDTFTYTVSDGQGGTSSTTLTITIHGTDDAPVAVADTGSANEGGITPATAASGNVLTNDTDVDNVHSDLVVSAVAGGTVGAGLAGAYGTVTINADGSYSYVIDDANPTVDALNVGGTLTDTFTYTVSDGQGGTSSTTLTITIHGTDDAPVAVNDSGSATEAGGTGNSTAGSNATGNVLTNDTDVDNTTASLVVSAIRTGAVEGSGSAGTLGSGLVGAHGTLTLNTNGSYTYVVNNNDAAVQALNTGGTLTDSFNYTVKDPGNLTDTAVLTITINGANDAPVGVDDTGSATEAGGVSNGTPGSNATGNVLTHDTDVDNTTASLVVSAIRTGTEAGSGTSGTVGSALTGAHGSLTLNADGSYSYAVNNGDTAVQALNSGGTLTDTFTYTVKDPGNLTDTAQLVVTINGTNDAAVISGTKTGIVIEAAQSNGSGTPTATGTLTDTDVDNPPNTFTASSGTTSHGSYTMTAGGVWTYTLNNFDPTVNALNTGQTLPDSFTVTTVDGTQQAINITIQGTTDSQLISAVINSKQSNANNPSEVTITFASAPGTVSATFANLSSVVTFANNPGTQVTGNGTFGNDGNGHATYVFNVDKGGNNGSSYDITIAAGAFQDTNGNTNTSATKTGLKPAGVSGETIDLGLTGHVGSDDFTIAGIPSGWTLSEGQMNADGSWSVQTLHAETLSITSPLGYVGAVSLQIVDHYTSADGGAATSFISNNVEVYAKNSPIFAWSGDDNLTGAPGHDTFVFSQPIGNDVVHSFEVSSDVIDLISYGWQSFADVQAHTVDDASGNAVITLADGQTITLDGVHASDLTVANFEFDVTPTVDNPGVMTIGDGAMLPLSGIINNTGEIDLQGSGDDTWLQLIQTGIKLEGGGQVTLSDDDHNIIAGTAPNVTLDNVDNVISGAGQLGQGSLTLSNEGTIDATGTHALVIDTGTNVIANAGTLEATGAGGLVLASAVTNSGLIWANGGTVTAAGEVTGSGNALISGAGTIEFGSASAAGVTFDTTAAGHLILDDAFHFSGTVSGLDGNDDIDIKGISFGAGTTLSFTENQAGTGGTLTVSDGVHTANIVLLGQYDPTGFAEKADTTNGTVITYDPHHIA